MNNPFWGLGFIGLTIQGIGILIDNKWVFLFGLLMHFFIYTLLWAVKDGGGS